MSTSKSNTEHVGLGGRVESADPISGTIVLSAPGYGRVTIRPCSPAAIESMRALALRYNETHVLPQLEIAVAPGRDAKAAGPVTLNALGVKALEDRLLETGTEVLDAMRKHGRDIVFDAGVDAAPRIEGTNLLARETLVQVLSSRGAIKRAADDADGPAPSAVRYTLADNQ